MKVICQTCKAGDATMLCLPDNIAVCHPCGSKQRSSVGKKVQKLSLSQPEQAHMCDICQDAPAYCVCVDERAVLCRECDLSIHKSNKFTEAHNRFLFPGIKLGLEDTASSSAAAAGPRGSKVIGSKRKASHCARKEMAAEHHSIGGAPQGGLAGSSGASTSSGVSMPSMLGPGASSNFGSKQVMQHQPEDVRMSLDSYPFSSTAAEFLGVPSLGDSITIKDVDAAYMADEFGSYAPEGIPDDVSHLLAVPDLDFSNLDDMPGTFAVANARPQGGDGGHWVDDGVVPDINYR